MDRFATGEGVAGSGFARLSVDGEAKEREIPVSEIKKRSKVQDGAQDKSRGTNPQGRPEAHACAWPGA